MLFIKTTHRLHMICITLCWYPVVCWKYEIVWSDSQMDEIVCSLPVMLHFKTHHSEITCKIPTIAHSLSLFPTPLSVKCLNHGLTWVTSQRCSEPFAHRKLMKSKCFLLAKAISFSSGAWHISSRLCWLCLFTAQHCWILDSDWLTGVLRLLIHFLFFVTGLLTPLQFCITFQCFFLTNNSGVGQDAWLVKSAGMKKWIMSWDKHV